MPAIPILPNVYLAPLELDRSRIPPDEMAAFSHIMTLLAELASHERRLLSAVYLYEFSRQAVWEITDFATRELSLWTTSHWSMMAARDGSLTIYHFGSTIEGITRSLPACPALNCQIDRPKLKNARKLFEARFPGYIAIRKVVAHMGDFTKTMRAQASHAVRGPFMAGGFGSEEATGITYLPGNMNEDKYTVTSDGKAFTYTLSRATVGDLCETRELIYSALAPAATINRPGV
jgi:hypothetical protein